MYFNLHSVGLDSLTTFPANFYLSCHWCVKILPCMNKESCQPWSFYTPVLMCLLSYSRTSSEKGLTKDVSHLSPWWWQDKSCLWDWSLSQHVVTPERHKAVTVFYTIIIHLIIPFIYSPINKEVMGHKET
jgi:hypothetical protein